MSGKIMLLIVKTILGIMKTILRIVVLETGYAERSRKFVNEVPGRHSACGDASRATPVA